MEIRQKATRFFQELLELFDRSKPSPIDFLPHEVRWKFQAQLWLGFLMFYVGGIGCLLLFALGTIQTPLAIPLAAFELGTGIWYLRAFRHGELVLGI